jgi:hypothetical protein
MNNKSLDECINFCLDKSIDKTNREIYLSIVKHLMSCKDVNSSYSYSPLIAMNPCNSNNSIVNYQSEGHVE